MEDTVQNKYTIRLAHINELTDIQEFIKKYWNDNHIFTKSSLLLVWQHGERVKEQLNFYIAIQNNSCKIEGILGFIPISKFDVSLENKDFWGAIWKVTPSATVGLGLHLMDTYCEEQKPVSHGSIGINKDIRKLYRLKKQRTGSLNHFYILSEKTTSFQIAKIPKKVIPIVGTKNDSFVIKEIVDVELLLNCNSVESYYEPKKSILYLINRYVKHPIYKYLLYGIYEKNSLKIVLIVRKIEINNSACLRIVDVLGQLETLPNLYYHIQELLQKQRCEYIDCLNAGIKENVFINIGFSTLDFEGKTIIPNYFEPFLQENIRILYACDTLYETYTVFKGDSDQDRPNVI